MAQPTVLITGASSGIGRALALRLARRGARVLAVGRRPDRLASLVSEASGAGEIVPLIADLRCADAVDALFDAGPVSARPLDAVVNNAGVAAPEGEATVAMPDAAWRATYAINLVGMLHVSRRAASALRAGGTLVHVASLAAIRHLPTQATYTATKAAMRALSACLAEELGAEGTRVALVTPGATKTDILRDFPPSYLAAHGVENEARLAADDVAAAIEYAIDAPAGVRLDEIVLSPLGRGVSQAAAASAPWCALKAPERRRTAIVTGATSGIGEAIARAFLRRGDHVVVHGLTDGDVTAARARLGEADTIGVVADLRHLDGARALWDTIERHRLSVDVAVHNAGVVLGGPFAAIDLRALDDLLAVNCAAVDLSCRHAARHFGARGGTIINIASNLAFTPAPQFAAYAASKAYVLALSSCLHDAWAAARVRVCAICPGAVDTQITQTLPAELRASLDTGTRRLSPDAIAQLAVEVAGHAAHGRLKQVVFEHDVN